MSQHSRKNRDCSLEAHTHNSCIHILPPFIPIHGIIQLDRWIDNLIWLSCCFFYPIPLTFQIVYLEPEGVSHLVFYGPRITSEHAVPSSLPEREASIVFMTEINGWVNVL